jgi:hypothetical protein
MHRISKISEHAWGYCHGLSHPPKKNNNPDVLKNVASFEEDHGD